MKVRSVKGVRPPTTASEILVGECFLNNDTLFIRTDGRYNKPTEKFTVSVTCLEDGHETGFEGDMVVTPVTTEVLYALVGPCSTGEDE